MIQLSNIYLNGTKYPIVDNTIPRINLLDNGFFTINSRNINATGVTETNDSAIYTVDRWKLRMGTIKKINKGVNFSNFSSTTWNRFWQNTSFTFPINEKITVTVNGKINQLEGKAGIGLFNSSGGIDYIKYFNESVDLLQDQQFIATFTNSTVSLPNIGAGIVVHNESNDLLDMDIYAIKLEIGTSSTLILDQKYGINEYFEEIKCKTSTVDINDEYTNKKISFI